MVIQSRARKAPHPQGPTEEQAMSAGTGGRAVGIDLGTSNSVVAAVIDGEAIVIADRQGQTIHPSVVSWLPDGRTLVGTAAKARMSSDPDHTVYSVKRLVGRPSRSEEVKVAQRKYAYRIVADGDEAPRVQVQDRNFTVEEVQALILRHMKRVAEEYLGEPVTRAVITVPANFNEAQRRATRMAGSLAGLEVLRILNEPTAAALAYGYEQDLRERIAVYDLGGGTFDVTILELRDNVLEVLSTAGDTFLGGDDFDMRLTDLLAQEFEKATGIALSQDQTAMQRLKSTSEQVKIQLSEALEAQATITHRVPQQPQPVQATVTITRQAFNRACQQLVQKSFLVCDEALKLAEITSAEVDRLVLVGGATRIPMVREMVEQYFFKKPLLDINPDEVVAVGAAIYAFGLDMQAGPPMPPQPPQRVPQASGPETALGSFPPADAPAPMEGGTAPTARGLPNVPRTQTMGAAPPPIPGQSATLLGNPPPPPPPPPRPPRGGAPAPPPPPPGGPPPPPPPPPPPRQPAPGGWAPCPRHPRAWAPLPRAPPPRTPRARAGPVTPPPRARCPSPPTAGSAACRATARTRARWPGSRRPRPAPPAPCSST
jgi:molecular chaperone DnaK